MHIVVQPEKVFAEIYRVLKPGGSCIMTFSNRLFYDKARLQPFCMHDLLLHSGFQSCS